MGWTAQCVSANSRRMRKVVFCQIAGIYFMLTVLTCGFCRIPLAPFAEAASSRKSQLWNLLEEQVSVTIPGRPIRSGNHDNLNSEQGRTASSGEAVNNLLMQEHPWFTGDPAYHTNIYLITQAVACLISSLLFVDVFV